MKIQVHSHFSSSKFVERLTSLGHVVVGNDEKPDVTIAMFCQRCGIRSACEVLADINWRTLAPLLFVYIEMPPATLVIRGAIHRDCADEELQQALQETAGLAKRS